MGSRHRFNTCRKYRETTMRELAIAIILEAGFQQIKTRNRHIFFDFFGKKLIARLDLEARGYSPPTQ
jgi:hypothetical protein